MTELWTLGLGELARAIRAGACSAEEVVRALLERIETVEPRVRAWETLDADEALAAAQAADRQRQTGAALGPLHGAPFGAKDLFWTRGVRTTYGAAPFRDFVPREDASAVERLRAAGAILLGKTVSTRFAFFDPPATRNPWSLEHTPGSSSSGAAAAVAARMAPLSLATQSGGSTLRPAGYCGVVGFKPSFGRISRYGVLPAAWTLDTVGIVVRSVEDAALALQATAGHDPRDRHTSREPVGDYLALARNPAAPRLALVRDFLERAAPVVAAHLEAVAARLRAAGARVEETRLPLEFDLGFAAYLVSIQAESAATHADWYARHRAAYAPGVRAFVETGLLIPAAAYVHAQRIRRRLRAAWDTLLEGADALLLPTASDQAPRADTTGDASFQVLPTLLGLPAIALPTGVSPDGLPLSTQLVGRRFGEAELLATARWVEREHGLLGAPPL